MLRILVVAVGGGAACVASAAKWDFSPFVEVSETYTDNIALQPEGKEEGSRVTQVNPGFSLSGDGRNLDLSVNYRLQNLFYANDSEFNTSNHRFLARMGSILKRDFLFFDASASLQQLLVDPAGDIGQGNISIKGNQSNVALTTLSPYIKTRLNSWSMVNATYRRDSIKYLDGITEDSVANTLSAEIIDAKQSDRLSWKLGASSRKVDYVTGLRASESWKSIDSDFGYRIGRKLDLTAKLGYENNTYGRGDFAATPKGPYWNAGFAWRPTPRTKIVLGSGERYFGPVWNFDLSHSGRRSSIAAGYSHTLSTRLQSVLELPLFYLDGSPVLDPETLDPVTGRISVNEVFIRQRGNLSANYRTLKAEFSLGLFVEFREYQTTLAEEKLEGGSISYRWRFSRRSTLSLRLSAVETDYIDRYSDQLFTSLVRYENKLGRQLVASLDFRQTVRDRENYANITNFTDYTENLLTARLTMNW